MSLGMDWGGHGCLWDRMGGRGCPCDRMGRSWMCLGYDVEVMGVLWIEGRGHGCRMGRSWVTQG